MKTDSTTIATYNSAQRKNIAEVCDALELHIDAFLGNGTAKIWHGSPVWFLDGNPIVSYSVRANGSVSLMFFSGQSFDEAKLKPSGSFKAAEIMYTDVSEIKVTPLKRWLKKSKTVQWDYKNIVKNKGGLTQLVI